MAVGVQQAWNTTASSNASADSNVSYAEGQTPASLNDAARGAMAAVKGFANQITGAKTTGGSANAQTFTSDSVAAITSYAAGRAFVFKAGYTNSGAATLNVDGVGAKSIKKGGAQSVLAANDIVAGGIYSVVYEASGDCFILINPETGQTSSGFQPLDATLTALAALSWSSLTPLLQFTAADTVSLVSAPKVTTLELGDATDTTLSRAGAGLLAVEGNTVAMLATANVFTAAQKISLSGVARQALRDTSAAANAGIWWAYSYQGDYIISAANDAENATSDAVAFRRSGATATRVDFLVPVTARLPRSSETSGTLTSASSNRIVVTTAGVTINDGVHTADDVTVIYNNSASPVTITQDAGMTLRLHGTTTTGNRTLGPRGIANVWFNSSSEAIVSGDVS